MDKDIDILAEEAWKNRGHSGYETIPALYKEGYISGIQSKELWTDNDMINALNYGYTKGHHEGLLYDMPEMNANELSLLDWLKQYKQSK